MLKYFPLLLPLLPCLVIADEVKMPEEAVKYHTALLRRPHQATLFDRFQGAWLDEASSDELEGFLKREAEMKGGASWSLLARYQLRRGQDEKALEALAKAIESSPDDAVLRMERSRVNARRLDFEKAAKDLERASESDDEEQALLASKMLGKVLLRSGDPEAAVKVWNETLKAHPDDEDLLEDLVELAAGEGEVEQALDFIEKLLETTKDPYRKALRQMQRGDLLGAAGKFDEALEVYSATLTSVGQGSWLEREVLAQIEKLFRKDQREADLKEHFEKLAEENSGRLLLHRQLAKLEAAEGEMDAAIGRFREVLKRSPGERELREECIRMLADGDRIDDAVVELEKLIEQVPGDSGLWLQMASLRHRQEKQEDVLSALEKARGLMADGFAETLRIAGLMLEYGLEEEGVAALRGVMDDGSGGAAATEILASYYSRSGKKDEAVELWKGLSEVEDLDTLLRASGALAALGGAEASFEMLEARREVFSGEFRFVAALIQAAMAAEKSGEAVADSRRLVRMAQGARELGDAVGLATRNIVQADQTDQQLEELQSAGERSAAETCLLAQLLEGSAGFDAVDGLFDDSLDPLMVRFHAALLERRGEFDRAVESMLRLADETEGRKASYLKELAELQRRAGDTEAALATAERWKQAAAADKGVWVFTAALLKERGKYDEALRETRKAVARFDGDQDLTATLATLYSERGEYPEAEGIYWRLYDESDHVSNKARWASQLARLASQSGRFAILEERLMERSRANRKSVGPILARAELARVMNNEEKRRDLLVEAVRLQPKDLDLRLQIATMEEEGGAAERAIAILEEALAYDKDNRVRRALAQACLRQGQVVKGLRQLRALAGGESPDLRELEQLTGSLAQSGLYEEAITMLREGMGGEGDWRANYLLALMLEEDGRELEAVPILQKLLDAEGEIEGVLAPTRNRYWDSQPPAVRGLMQMMQVENMAYAHRSGNRYGGNYGMSGAAGPFQLPGSAEVVRLLALVHLFELEGKLNEAEAEGISRYLAGIGSEEIEIFRSLRDRPDRYQGWHELLKLHPGHVGLMTMSLMYAGHDQVGAGLTPEFLRRAAKEERMQVGYRFAAAERLLDLDSSDAGNVDLYLKTGEAMAEEDDENKWQSQRLARSIVDHLKSEEMSEDARKLLRSRLGEFRGLKGKDGEDLFKGWLAFAVVLEFEEEPDLAAMLNSELLAFRKELAKAGSKGHASHHLSSYGHSLRSMRSRGGSSGQIQQYLSMGRSMLSRQESLPLDSIPSWLPNVFGGDAAEEQGGEYLIESNEMLASIDRIDSPSLRLWMALRAGDEEAIAQALSADPPTQERTDFALLALLAQSREEEIDPKAKFERLKKARDMASANRDLSTVLDVEMLSLSTSLDEKDREQRADELRALLIRCRSIMGTSSRHEIAAIAEDLGFEDLSKRFLPRMVSGAGSIGMRGASISGVKKPGSSSDPMQKIASLSAAGKHKASANEAWRLIRSMRSQPYYNRTQLGGLRQALGDDAIGELKKMMAPGTSKSRVKRLDYVDLCELIGAEEERIELLEEMLIDRPKDATVAAKLAFSPGVDGDRAKQLLDVAQENGDDLVVAAQKYGERVIDQGELEKCLKFFEVVAGWLQSADPEKLEKANLTWVSYYGKRFFDSLWRWQMPSLLAERDESKKEETADEKRRREIAVLLLEGMSRHAALAESGFRLQWAMKPRTASDEELDIAARQAILGSVQGRSSRGGVFDLRMGNGSSSYGDDLDTWSSWNWFSERLQSESPAVLWSEAFLEKIRDKDENLAAMLERLGAVNDTESVAAFWDASELDELGMPLEGELRNALVVRAQKIPGTGKFFLDRLLELPEPNIKKNVDPEVFQLGEMVLRSAAIDGSKEVLDQAVAAYIRVVIGSAWNPEKIGNGGAVWNRLNQVEQMARSIELENAPLQRLFAAFFRARFPLSNNNYSYRRPFENLTFKNKEEDALKFFSEAGLLSDVEDWVSPGGMIYVYGSGGPAQGVTVSRFFGLEEAINNISYGNDFRRKIVKALEEREEGRFGSLMLLAAMHSGAEREAYAGTAFSEVGDRLEALSKEQLEMVGLPAQWLSEEARMALPQAIGELLEEEQKRRMEESVAKAELALKRLSTRGGSTSAFNTIQNTLSEVMVGAPEKALQLYEAAELEFTLSLARGGRFSNWTSNGMQVSERDASLRRLLDTGLRSGEGELDRLRFLQMVRSSDAARRLSFSLPGRNGIMELSVKTTYERLRDASKKSGTRYPDELESLLDEVDGTEEDLREMMYVGLMCAHLHYWSGIGDSDREKAFKMLEERDESVWTDLARCVVGGIAWSRSDDEFKAATRNRLISLIKMNSVSVEARMELVHVLVEEADGMVRDASVISAYNTLYQEYLGEERSAVSLWSRTLLDQVARPPLSAEMREPVAKLLELFWSNAKSPRKAGHSTIPAQMAKNCLKIAIFSKSDLVDQLMPQLRVHCLGDFPMLLALVEAGEFEFAKGLLSPLDQPFAAWTTPTKWSQSSADKFAEFREWLGDPLQSLKIEAESMFLNLEDGDKAPEEAAVQRAARLFEEFNELKPEPLKLRNAILRSLVQYLPDKPEMGELLLDWAESENFGQLVLAEVDGNGSSSRRAFSQADAKVASELYQYAALHALSKGDLSLLAEVEAGYRKAAGLKNSNYQFERSFESFCRRCSLMVVWMIASGKMEGFQEGAGYFAELATFAATQPDFDQDPEFRLPMLIAQSMWALTERPKSFGEFRQAAGDDVKKDLKSYKGPPDMCQLAIGVGSHRRWRNDPDDAMKHDYVIAMLTLPGVNDLYPQSAGWVAGISRAGLKDVIAGVISDPPEAIAPRPKLALSVYQARELVRKKQYEEAQAIFEEVIGGCDGDGWVTFRNTLRVELAEVSEKKGDPEAATAILEAMSEETLPDWLEARRKKLVKKLNK